MHFPPSKVAISISVLAFAACTTSTAPSATPQASDDAGADNTPTTPAVISSVASSIFETEPTIAVAPDGTLAVGWLDQLPGNAVRLGVTFSHDRGDTWDPPQLLPLPDNRFPSNEIIASDNQGDFYLVTLGVTQNSSASSVLVSKAATGTTTFGPWVEVTDPAMSVLRDASALVVAQDQSLNVVYVEYSASLTASVVVSARSADGGATWTRSPITDSTAMPAWTNLCASRDGTRVAAVYVDGGKYATEIRWSEDNGATWPTTNQNEIDIAPFPGEFPSCVTAGQDLWVMQGISATAPTAATEPTLQKIELVHSGDGGHTLDTAVFAQDPAAGSKYMRAIAVLDGDRSLSLSYYAGVSNNDPQASVRRTRSTDGGKTFAPSDSLYSPIVLTTSRTGNNWLGDLMGVTADAHSTFAAFVDNSSGNSHIRFSRLTP